MLHQFSLSCALYEFPLKHIVARSSLRCAASFCPARSPVLGHLTISLAGLPCIRAVQAEKRQLDEFHRLMDEHTRAYYLIIGSSRWVSARMDIICVSFLAVVAALCIVVGIFGSKLNTALVILTPLACIFALAGSKFLLLRFYSLIVPFHRDELNRHVLQWYQSHVKNVVLWLHVASVYADSGAIVTRMER